MKIQKRHYRYINHDDELEIPWMVKNSIEIANSLVLIIAAQIERKTIDDFTDVYRVTCAALEQQMAILDAVSEMLEKAGPPQQGPIPVPSAPGGFDDHEPPQRRFRE
ncbi:hypothetical protein LJC22_04255 [Desulfosarcina sp. OttesenSCG-928-G10]|nr:hypothetical protein [Desulfosarcina sp. OttesenSCG-928-G10]